MRRSALGSARDSLGEKAAVSLKALSQTATYGTQPAKRRQDLGLRPSIRGECSAQCFQLLRHRAPRRPSGGGAALHRVLPRSQLGQRRGERGMDAGRHGARHSIERHPGALGLAHQATDEAVALAKRHAGFHQQVGEVRRAQRGIERGPHPLGVHAQRGDGPGRGGQDQRQRVESVEQQRLVLLEVLAVPGRKALQGREQRHEVAQQPARFRARQLEDVGVPFLRQQARAGAEVVRQPHESKLRARIEHDFGRQAREVRAHEGERKQDFGDEVAVARRIQGVRGDRAKPECFLQQDAIDGKPRSRERPGSERQLSHAATGVRQALAVAHQRPGVREQHIGPAHRLGTLAVRVPGQQGIHALHGARHQCASERGEVRVELVDRPERPETQIGRHLVVARSARMQLAGDGTHLRVQQSLHEDVHTLVERLLYAEVGTVAGKLHTGRSRNDQVATDLRLWTLGAIDQLDADLAALGRALVARAVEGVDALLPGYTHGQRAQPVRWAYVLLAHAWPLVRDRQRLADARRRVAELPLGSGALAGSGFAVDRVLLKEALGFRALCANALDATGDRDFVAEVLFALSLVGTHLSRLAAELVLYSSAEYGFVRLSDDFSTGSSLLPQKRNPDIFELARAKSGRLLGDLVALLTTLKGLPAGYSKDLQEDKALLFDGFDTLALVLPAATGAIAALTVDAERMRAALDASLRATDLADLLVEAGVPFRESHGLVGRLVHEAERSGVPLDRVPGPVAAGIHPALAAALSQLGTWEDSVESRATPGGASRRSVVEQLEALRPAFAEGGGT